MTDDHRMVDTGPLIPLYPEDDKTAEFIPWRTVRPHEGEAVRWECIDGRWVALSIGHGVGLGTVLVTDSSGRCESLDSYESALDLAKRSAALIVRRFKGIETHFRGQIARRNYS